MEARAIFKNIRQAPRKLRLVVDQVRGKNLQEALDLLEFSKKHGAVRVKKCLKSALANADQKGGARLDKLYVKKAFVDEAVTMKRFLPRARGSASRINKKMSHLTVVLDERQ